MLIGPEQHVQLATLELRTALDKFSIAVLTADSKGAPIFIGTGFCVSIAGRTYFVTAAHVADSKLEGIYLGKRAFSPFVSEGYVTRSESEPLDMAVLPITEAQMLAVGAEPIPEKMIDQVGIYTTGFHCLMGYPASKNKLGKAVRLPERRIDSVCYGINTEAVEVNYELYAKVPSLHLALRYDTAIDGQNRKYKPPSLRGVSGAPLWVTQDRFDLSKVLLGGFLIEYHQKGKVAFCTRAQHILGFVRARYA